MAENKKTFEEALDELEKITEGLESGELDLEETIKLYEQGIKLSKLCEQTLQKAKQKIEVLGEE